MTDFDDIRPYNDSEVRPVLDRLVKDPELINALCRLRFPKAGSGVNWLLKPLVAKALQRQFKGWIRSQVFRIWCPAIWTK